MFAIDEIVEKLRKVFVDVFAVKKTDES